jgi:hypothetical protein
MQTAHREHSEVYVGPERVEWNLHENLLCNASQFIRSALKGRFKEALDKSIELPEDDTAAFDLFVRWLYASNRFPLGIPGGEDILYNYLKLYVLASGLLIPRLQNTVIDAVYRYFRYPLDLYPALQDVHYILREHPDRF